MKTAPVCGAGGFFGALMVKRLKREGFWVRGVDRKLPEFAERASDESITDDLREAQTCRAALDRRFDEVYQFAADMGGAGYLFIGDNDADIMHNSATLNLNIFKAAAETGSRRIFYASSACVYPVYHQEDPDDPRCTEDTVYPAQLQVARRSSWRAKVDSVSRSSHTACPAGTVLAQRQPQPEQNCGRAQSAGRKSGIWLADSLGIRWG